MEITINGESRTVADGTMLLSLIRDLCLPETRVAVERNRSIVRKADFAATSLADGDRLEIVTFVGGG